MRIEQVSTYKILRDLVIDIPQIPSQLGFLVSLRAFINLALSFFQFPIPFSFLSLVFSRATPKVKGWRGQHFLPGLCLCKQFESLRISMSAPHWIPNLMQFHVRNTEQDSRYDPLTSLLELGPSPRAPRRPHRHNVPHAPQDI